MKVNARYVSINPIRADKQLIATNRIQNKGLSNIYVCVYCV